LSEDAFCKDSKSSGFNCVVIETHGYTGDFKQPVVWALRTTDSEAGAINAPGGRRQSGSWRSKTLDFATCSSTIIVVETLAKHIAAHLEEQAFCLVFEDDLERCWPRREMARAEREREIQSFAESRGWAAAIVEGGFGTRAIFRGLEPGADNYEGSSAVTGI
jgi:hypothetical protein